ncbi:MAG: DoxX family protein [Flavobacteriales bacterium]|nr:DoxX family protein [Flavobacteriales bacterium]
MAGIYILAGIYHFVNPKFYLKIIPPYIPWHKAVNYLSGATEIILGVLLFYPPYATFAAWGIMGLLIAIFPANIYHLTSAKPGKGIPIWVLWLRIPLQGLFIWWARWYTFT